VVAGTGPAALSDEQRHRRPGDGPVEQDRQFYQRLAEGLIAYAEAYFQLEKPVGEGKLKAPLRVHLEAQARQGDAEAIWRLYHGPKLSPLAAHLWTWWLDLCATRPVTGMGISPLSRMEIQAWEADEGVELTAWERRTILRLDAAFRAASQSE
jgi:hypothetical protein